MSTKTVNYLEELVKEIEKSLHCKCYLSAVNNAMILIDSMSKAKNPPLKSLKNKDRFVNFCDKSLRSKEEIGLTGEELYSIRNFMFHEGCMNIRTKETKIKCINFYINSGLIHSSSILNNEFANIDVTVITKLVIDYFNKNKASLDMTKIDIIQI